MGIFDGIGDQVAAHEEKIDGAIDKGAEMLDKATGNKFGDKIDSGAEFLKEKVEDLAGKNKPAAE
ncbi:antitoxin [Arachnia propionica]|uniref:Antitoxin n=1 Tax=Arachnia propionica TaxID=1750 RepID=A0A3P1WSW8_9ACTN|nr:antitoxin [Arachnia propionica]RRD49086.1 antitoxin [Arachnia propionica]